MSRPILKLKTANRPVLTLKGVTPTPAPNAKTPTRRDAVKELAHHIDVIDPQSPIPLAIGALDQIKPIAADRLGWSGKKTRRVLGFYTGSAAYHAAVLKGQARINIDGTAADPITDKQREHAQRRLDAINARRKADG